MALVAHLDDDLLFMNPDIQESIDAGGGHTTVYLVGWDGEQDGDEYWQGREAGVKDAYAEMTGADDWVETIATFSDGTNSFDVSTAYLESQPDIRLYFLRIVDGSGSGEGFPNGDFQSLEKLWDGEIPTIDTVDETNTFTAEQVSGLLLGIIEHHQPETIMRQDHETIYHGGDHSGHIHTSLFVEEAQEHYDTPHETISYLEYATADLAENLTIDEAHQTLETFNAYALHDPYVYSELDENGDPILSENYLAWTSRHYHTDQVELLEDDPYAEAGANFPDVIPISFVSETIDYSLQLSEIFTVDFVDIDGATSDAEASALATYFDLTDGSIDVATGDVAASGAVLRLNPFGQAETGEIDPMALNSVIGYGDTQGHAYRFETELQTEGGVYDFDIAMYNSAAIYVNGDQVLLSEGGGVNTGSGTVSLDEGAHSVVILYAKDASEIADQLEVNISGGEFGGTPISLADAIVAAASPLEPAEPTGEDLMALLFSPIEDEDELPFEDEPDELVSPIF